MFHVEHPGLREPCWRTFHVEHSDLLLRIRLHSEPRTLPDTLAPCPVNRKS